MRPFWFLGTRADDEAADAEYESVLAHAGLDEQDVRRVRMERDHLPEVDLAAASGVIVGGGPFNNSDPYPGKSRTQVRVEAELAGLLVRVLATDFPFLGACYGIGALGQLPGGLVDRTYAEPVGPMHIVLSEAGRRDRLFGALPTEFDAYLGHKEAITRLPHGAVLLASSATCPVQALRIGRNVYATQFHPELGFDELALRIRVYRDHGYFEPSEADAVVAAARRVAVTHPPRLLSRFVELFARD